jgi:sec-independent protein translocase protein TatC
MISAVAFYTGVFFSFFFVLPFALNFLISYGVNAGFIPQISIAQYVGFALWFLLVFGLIFEVPLAITLMAKLGWVSAPVLKRYRKWAFLGAFLVAAILTPTPDPFNQCLMALPMYVFYEVGIISAGVFGRKATEPASAATQGSGKSGVPMAKPAMTTGEYVSVPDHAHRR